MQKGIDGTAHDHAKIASKGGCFLLGKQQHVALTLVELLTQSAAFECKKSNAREVKFTRVHGARLKEMEEWIDCVSRVII